MLYGDSARIATGWMGHDLNPGGGGGEIFLSSRPAPWPNPAYRVSLPRVKWPGYGMDHQLLSRAEVKGRVEL
jgi:hypothetical protein